MVSLMGGGRAMLSMGAPLFAIGCTLGVAGLGLFVGISFDIDVKLYH